MDSNNATILALALGIPCATVLSIACLLTLRISHQQWLARRIRNPTVPTNSPAPSPPPEDPYHGIPLEQRPPRILAPIPRRSISIDSLARIARQETVDGGISRSVSTEVPEGNPPTPPRRRQPVIIVSPSTTAAESSTVHPSTSTSDGHDWNNSRRFDVGRDIRIATPSTDDHTRDTNPTASSAPVSSSEFWDNITIPLSAYFPAPRDDDTEYQGAPPIWGQPISINDWEQYAQQPLSTIEEPVASTSRLPVPDSNDSSYWSNAIEQRPGRRARIHRRNWSRIARQLSAEPHPPPELLAPPESRYYEYFTDETTGEGTLQEHPRRPDTPIPTIPDAGTISESTPEPPQSPSDPGSTSDDPV